METAFLAAIAAAAIRASTPLLLACIGEIITERAGVLNLGVEGLMLVGALSGFAVTIASGSLFLGLVAASVGAALLALLHAFASITLRANQIVSGLALVFLATGVTDLFGRPYVGMTQPARIAASSSGPAAWPIVGPILLAHDPIVYLSYLLVPATWYFLFRTRPGLHLRAVGESPETADAMGVSVVRVRYLATGVGGALAGLGGAYLSLLYTPLWVPQMTAGRGWIALALVAFASWEPRRALLGAILFGGIDVLQFRLQAAGSQLPSDVLLMLPYLGTIIFLTATQSARARRSEAAPAALGLAYTREERV
ncbi:MAG: ABC transporter permease [Candidatus Rokuibacteriota bacterium]